MTITVRHEIVFLNSPSNDVGVEMRIIQALKVLEDKIMGQYDNVEKEMEQVASQLEKVYTEVSGLGDKVAAMQSEIDKLSNPSQTFLDAWGAVKAKIQAVDDLTPDAAVDPVDPDVANAEG
jgi:archaellum component FlaC